MHSSQIQLWVTLKNEYGAKLGIPDMLIVDIHPIGLGITMALRGFSRSVWPFLGS